MANTQQKQQHPLVLIAGGGPAGLISSILLDKIGINSIVIERATEPDEW
jgi:2-polyprenyl-6-methoxyphenol hydroxylase-like FAD-dependent oxidoreductase